jgi:hypothetical protein
MVMADGPDHPHLVIPQSTEVRARTRLQAGRTVLPAYGPIGPPADSVTDEVRNASHRNDRPGQTRRETGTQSQGPPSSHGGRPAAGPPMESAHAEVTTVKANLARFTMALVLLASVAMSVGAGMRW